MMFSQKNRKLGLIPSFNISTEPCRKIKQCRNCYAKYCYARKIERIYRAFRLKNLENYKLSLKKDFTGKAVKELKFLGDYFRIHTSGEFYNQEYLNKWFRIARAYPKKIFYCYTKRYDLSFYKRPKNMIIYLSDDYLALQKYYNRFDGVAYVRFDKSKPIEAGFKLCTNQTNKEVQCSDCLLCTKKGKKICFDRH